MVPKVNQVVNQPDQIMEIASCPRGPGDPQGHQALRTGDSSVPTPAVHCPCQGLRKAGGAVVVRHGTTEVPPEPF